MFFADPAKNVQIRNGVAEKILPFFNRPGNRPPVLYSKPGWTDNDEFDGKGTGVTKYLNFEKDDGSALLPIVWGAYGKLTHGARVVFFAGTQNEVEIDFAHLLKNGLKNVAVSFFSCTQDYPSAEGSPVAGGLYVIYADVTTSPVMIRFSANLHDLSVEEVSTLSNAEWEFAGTESRRVNAAHREWIKNNIKKLPVNNNGRIGKDGRDLSNMGVGNSKPKPAAALAAAPVTTVPSAKDLKRFNSADLRSKVEIMVGSKRCTIKSARSMRTRGTVTVDWEGGGQEVWPCYDARVYK
jgi:hypothetical protein